MPGPVPGRNAERHSPDKHRVNEEIELDEAVEPLRYNPAWGWDDLAREWFESLHNSGQSQFYEPSDWQTARLVAEQINRELEDKFVGITNRGEVIMRSAPIPGASLTAMTKLMSSLMITEGDRRRLKLEIQRKKALDDLGLPEGVADMDEWRNRALGG